MYIEHFIPYSKAFNVMNILTEWTHNNIFITLVLSSSNYRRCDILPLLLLYEYSSRRPSILIMGPTWTKLIIWSSYPQIGIIEVSWHAEGVINYKKSVRKEGDLLGTTISNLNNRFNFSNFLIVDEVNEINGIIRSGYYFFSKINPRDSLREFSGRPR